jgi:hypothetical protein
MHEAIRELRVGRGWGVFRVPVVSLAREASGSVWHVESQTSATDTICGRSLKNPSFEENIDAKVVSLQGKPVCANCRLRLGHVPMPSLVKTPPNERTAA